MDTDLTLLDRFIKNHPLQAAQSAQGLDPEEIAPLLGSIPVELAISLVELMNSYKAAKCLKLLNLALAVELLEKVDVQKAELVLRQVDDGLREEWLARISPKRSGMLRQKLEYSAYAVGTFMDPLGFVLNQDMAVRDVMNTLKGQEGQMPPILCVAGQDGAFTGTVPLPALLSADEARPIAEIMTTETPTFFAGLPVDSIKDHPGWQENLHLPVVDGSDKLIGSISLKAVRKKDKESGQELAKHIMETGNALGELYRIGIAAFLQSVSKDE